MAKQFGCIETKHHEFILQQHIFFAGSAAAEGRVNISPKDTAALRILSPNRVAYLDQTGSGNETAAHLRAHGRLTLMFCAFAGAPLILRLYGQGKVLPRGGLAYSELLASAFENDRASWIAPDRGARYRSGPNFLRIWRSAIRIRCRAPHLDAVGRGKR